MYKPKSILFCGKYVHYFHFKDIFFCMFVLGCPFEHWLSKRWSCYPASGHLSQYDFSGTCCGLSVSFSGLCCSHCCSISAFVAASVTNFLIASTSAFLPTFLFMFQIFLTHILLVFPFWYYVMLFTYLHVPLLTKTIYLWLSYAWYIVWTILCLLAMMCYNIYFNKRVHYAQKKIGWQDLSLLTTTNIAAKLRIQHVT